MKSFALFGFQLGLICVFPKRNIKQGRKKK